MKTGIELIAQERQEQIEKHYHTVGLDRAENDCQQLAYMAAALILSDWDYCPKDWEVPVMQKMMNKPYKERVIIAAALLGAEVDRIQGDEEEKELGF